MQLIARLLLWGVLAVVLVGVLAVVVAALAGVSLA